MREQEIRFVTEDGLTLAATLLGPAQGAPAVVFAHGWGSSRASERNRAIAEALVSAGCAALLFDFRGHGASEGSAQASTLDDQARDLRAALDWLYRSGLRPIGVAGSSSGGAVALAVAAGDPRVEALVLRAPSADAKRSHAARVSAPTLVVQGEADSLCERNRALAESLAGEHRFCAVPGAGHLFEQPAALETAKRETVAWLSAHLMRANRARPLPTRFRDRAEAGRFLAERLAHLRPAHAVAVALPRGGIAVAEPIAEALGAELDVFVSRKIRAPLQPELAIGAVAEGGVVVWKEDIVASLGLSAQEREHALVVARRDLDERLAAYRAVAPRIPLTGRAVIVIDDGVATGATLEAALRAIAELAPARLVVALPGGPEDTLAEIRQLPGVDELVVLLVPSDFEAVGQLYERFDPVATEAVLDALRRRRAGQRREPGSRSAPPRAQELP